MATQAVIDALSSSPKLIEDASKAGLSPQEFIQKNKLIASDLKSKYDMGLKDILTLTKNNIAYNPNSFDVDWFLSHLTGSAASAANQLLSSGYWYNPVTGNDEPVNKNSVANYIYSNYAYGSPTNAIKGGDIKFDTNNIYNAAAQAATSPAGDNVKFQSLLNSNKWSAAELKKQGITDADLGTIRSTFNAYPYSEKSPFSSLAAGNTSVPSVAGYSSGAPADWGNLYSAIQSGSVRLNQGQIIDPNTGDPTVGWQLIGPNGQAIDNKSASQVGDNLYRITSRNGDYTTDFYVRTDPYSGYVEPIFNPQQIASYRSNYANNSFIGGLVSGVSNAIKDLGPLTGVALGYATGGLGSLLAEQLGISQAAGTALASAGVQVASGTPIDQALQKAATSFIGGTAGSAVNSLVDEVAAAQNYGTDLGSQQTAMLAAQEAGMGSATDIAGNVAGKLAGSTIAGTLSGQDLGTAAAQGAVNAGINLGSSLLSNASLGSTGQTTTPDIFTDTTAAEIPAAASDFTQETDVTGEPIQTVTPDGNVDAQGNTTYVDAQGNPVTSTGEAIPNANERTPLEGGGFKTVNPNGSVTYEDPDGSVYVVNPDGTYTTQSMGQTNTYDPSTGTFTQQTPTVTANPVTSTPGGLSQSQIESLLKTGTGLLTGAAGATALANALGGSSGSSTTPATATGTQAGTSSALNPYNAAYFQQVQQNYNRLFPTAPADISTPLQSWYSTQYVPDTSISKKLFGV